MNDILQAAKTMQWINETSTHPSHIDTSVWCIDLIDRCAEMGVLLSVDEYKWFDIANFPGGKWKLLRK